MQCNAWPHQRDPLSRITLFTMNLVMVFVTAVSANMCRWLRMYGRQSSPIFVMSVIVESARVASHLAVDLADVLR
jgi:nucleoside recognition membrane protein YjiH